MNNNQIEGFSRVFDGLAIAAIISFVTSVFGYLNVKAGDYWLLILAIFTSLFLGYLIRKGIK